MSDATVGRAFRVIGVVQGVGFRWFCREIATQTGTSGWVANMSDGSVHGEVFGRGEAVSNFLAEIARGPTLGRVERIDSSEVEPQSMTGFKIRK